MLDHRKSLIERQLLYQQREEDLPISDVYDGRIIQEHLIRKRGLFNNIHDMALQIQMDAVLVIKADGGGKPRHITPVIIQNQNLPIHLRTKKRNLHVSMILPGPGEPTHYHSFLRPAWKDFNRLDKGVPEAIDGTDLSKFTLRAHLTTFIGDQKVANVMTQLKGAGSKSGCRLCDIKGQSIK